MNWYDTGFLISKNRYNENSLISEFYTKNHGKISGIVFGGTSKKIKNYLQIGNKIHVNFYSKSDNKIGYFKISDSILIFRIIINMKFISNLKIIFNFF